MSKKFFNTVVGEDKASIYIYGDIGDYVSSAEYIVRELREIQQTHNKIEVRVNSNGGEVYAGIAIVNALRNSCADITIYVDGIAASMASVIALCGKPVYMSKYSRLMLHSVKVGVYGDKEELRVTIEEIEALEKTLCQLVAEKMNKTPEEVRASYFDGKDHWFSAAEALSKGLIDGIYDVDPLPENSSTEQIYKIFNNRLTEAQTKNRMNLEEIRKKSSFVNAATDADVLRVIDSLETEAGKVPGLTEQVTALQGRVTDFENREAAAVEAERTALLDTAVADERIKAVQRQNYEALLKADFANGKAVLEALPKKKRVVDVLGNPSEIKEGAWNKRQKEIDEKNKNKK